jgi:type I restriction enzyme S subunit
MRDGWVETKLVDAVEVLDRFRKPINSTEREGRQGSVPYYGANGQAGWIDDSIFNEELVLLGEDAIDFADPNARKAYLISGPSWVNNHAHVLRAKPEKVYSYFLAEALNKVDYSQYVSFGTRSKLTQGSMNGIKVLLPPLPEQKRIVDLISSVDSYIEALHHQLESAKKSRNAVLHELLTAGGDDWVETTLGEICAEGLFADGDWVESKDQDPEGEYRLLQLADIGDGTFLNKSDRWMSREQFNRLGCTKLEVNDVLIARMPDPIGRACLFPEGLPVCATVVDVAIVRTGNETLQKFLALLINSSDFRTEASSLLTGTTRQRISRGNLAKISFAIPSQEKQLEIVNLISLFDGEIAQSVRVIEEAKQLRSGLLSNLLSGEHEIPVTYDKVIGAA